MVEDNKPWWKTLSSNTVSGFTRYQLGYIFHGAVQLVHAQHIIAWHPLMVESLDLGEAVADDREALVIIENALVKCILGTFSIPGKINHVHFLTAMVADHTKKSPSVTSADVAQVHARHWYPAPKHCRRNYQQQARMVEA